MTRQLNNPTRLHVRPAKTQMSLSTLEVWPESMQRYLWVAKDPKRLQVDSADSTQSAQMYRLIWVFAGRTFNFVGNAVPRLINFIVWAI